jgi:exodeoxyribonuclease-5
MPQACLAAPTGKAATVLRRKTGLHVTTLHRLLYVPQLNEWGDLIRFIPRCEPGALAGQVVLVDECSMVGADVGRDLLATGARIVAAGDHGQLPPVDQAPFFTHADFMLRDIRRQAAGSPIIRQARAVRSGQSYAPDGDAFQLVDRHAAVSRLDWADVVLCWRNETRHRINSFARKRRGIAPDALPQPGEPVMCLENQANGHVMNGEIFTVRSWDKQHGLQLAGTSQVIERAWFEWLRPDQRPPRWAVPFALAYAITVHKAQGSEWPRVLILDEFDGTDRARWLYTAITRATAAICIASRSEVAE